MTNNVSLTGLNASGAVGASSNKEAQISDQIKKLASSAKTASLDKTELAKMSQEDLKKELEQLKVERKLDVLKIEKFEAHIQMLAEEAANMIKEAVKEQNKAVEQHEEETQSAIKTEIQNYIEANKKEEGSMSRTDLANNIANAIGDPNLSKYLDKLFQANQEIAMIDDMLGKINSLTLELESLDLAIADTNSAIEESAKKAAAAQSSNGCCDPIGFKQGQTKYDFIVDDGKFDTTGDFLGAKDQWEAMKALDTDNDGIVTAKELKDGNIRAVKTDENGTQSVVDLADEFGEDFSVNLGSYTQGGAFDGIDSKLDADGNGIVDQQLLGTFSVNISGQEVKGYNTLDDVEYLKNNYNVSGDESTSADVQSYRNFFITYTQKSAELKQELQEGYKKYGLSEDTIAEIDKAAKQDGEKQANVFDEQLKNEEANERLELEKEAEAEVEKWIKEHPQEEDADKTTTSTDKKDKTDEDEELKKKKQ